MSRRSRDARQPLMSLLRSTTSSPDNADRGGRSSQLLILLFIVAFIIVVSSLQLFSISMISNPTGMFFSRIRSPWAVVVIACNRPWYLEPVLKQLLSLPKEQLSTVSVFLSQDGYDKGVGNVARRFKSDLTHWQRPRSESEASTYHLADHYKWTLDKLFFDEGFSHVIILEEDLLVSNDFLSYFRHTAGILDLDGRVMCISSHNDVGRKDVAVDASRLFRTSFFPGLGWMLKKSFWEELSPMWPNNHFDWWLRSSAASRGRVCIAPEVNRVRHIGHIGVNCNKDKLGQSHYNVNLTVSVLPSDSFYESDEPVDYTPIESLLRPVYDRRLSDLVHRAELLNPQDTDRIGRLVNGTLPLSDSQQIFLIVFRNQADYESLQKVVFLEHFSEQRSFYRGILELSLPKGTKLLIANARTCVFLPASLRYTQPFGIVPIVSEEGASCDDACKSRDMVCSQDRFGDVSDAYTMESFFPCERNAWVLDDSSTNPRYHRWPEGQDKDAFSSGVSEGTCFASSDRSECGAKQPGAIRLCPCSRSQDHDR